MLFFITRDKSFIIMTSTVLLLVTIMVAIQPIKAIDRGAQIRITKKAMEYGKKRKIGLF